MPKVCFLIPASPTRAFWSQIAVFQAALKSLRWSHWEPSVLVAMGGEIDDAAWAEWSPELREIATLFVPPAESARTEHYYAQIDGLFRWAPLDADVFARMDADTLPVGDLEDLLDYVVESRSIAGVMAHQTFPVERGLTSREGWLQAAEGLIDVPLDFRYSYSLADPAAREDNRLSPFYLNDGAVFFPKAVFREYAERYLDLRPRLMERLRYPYFSGQVALALAVAAMGARTCALPMRYNFPNDALAEQRFPEELQNVKIFHYLRTDQFDRQLIFTGSDQYQQFLQVPLTGSNKVFQEHVRRIIGPEFPFLSAQEPS